jgi:predicted deacetylase
MTAPRYLLRFDDICPTMRWSTWEAIEAHLVAHDIRPILAVVPDNIDPKLKVDPPAPDFWDRVRRWQAMGYTIGLHGYQHHYVNNLRGLMKLTPHSEFTGLSYAEQDAKISKGLAIFAEQGVRAECFVAPSHSFDRTTLEVLRKHGVMVISDGPWPWPHQDADQRFWLPQQLWQLSPRPAGIWTACLHPIEWKDKDLARFKDDVTRFAAQMTDLPTVLRDFSGRALTAADQLRGQSSFFWFHRLRPFAKRCLCGLGMLRASAR